MAPTKKAPTYGVADDQLALQAQLAELRKELDAIGPGLGPGGLALVYREDVHARAAQAFRDWDEEKAEMVSLWRRHARAGR